MLPEQDAFIEKLYHEFFTQLWIYAKAALGDPEQAQEVVQDTIQRAGLWMSSKRKSCTLAVP